MKNFYTKLKNLFCTSKKLIMIFSKRIAGPKNCSIKYFLSLIFIIKKQTTSVDKFGGKFGISL